MNFNAGVPGCSCWDVGDLLSQRGRGRHSVPIQAFCRGLQRSLPLTMWSGLGHIALSFAFLSCTMGSSWSWLLCVSKQSPQGRAGVPGGLCSGRHTSCLERDPFTVREPAKVPWVQLDNYPSETPQVWERRNHTRDWKEDRDPQVGHFRTVI